MRGEKKRPCQGAKKIIFASRPKKFWNLKKKRKIILHEDDENNPGAKKKSTFTLTSYPSLPCQEIGRRSQITGVS